MPLLDHFHPPLYPKHPWESFHANWATRLADALTLLVPPEFQVEQQCHGTGRVEIDVAAYEAHDDPGSDALNGTAARTQTAPAWTPPAAAYHFPALFPDTFEVRVFSTLSGLTLAAAIELISPGNKDRPDERRAFAVKCASYLHQGVALIIIDIVTSRRANLHNELLRLLGLGAPFELDEGCLYAVAYRPVRRGEQTEVEVWPATLALGAALPTLPLRLTGDLFVPVDFDATYHEACRRRRLG